MLTISPSSGIDNSYYDIAFKVSQKEGFSSPFKMSFINKTDGSHLQALATSSGFIDNDGIIFSEPCKSVDGYLNLFNDDKMNKKLENYKEVEIECKVEGAENYTFAAIFYNEAYSVDSKVLPFSIKVEKSIVDLSSGVPLKLILNSDSEKSLHLSIEAKTKKVSYDFYVFTDAKEQKIEIPLEILNYELNLYKMTGEKFRVFYLKRHGVTYNNIVNEKKIAVPDVEIEFINNLQLYPQDRLDPLGKELSYDEYLISDRYFVPTLKEYSFFSRKMTDVKKSLYDSTFRDEILSARDNSQNFVSDNFWRSEHSRPVKQVSERNDLFYRSMNKIISDDSSIAEKLKSSAPTRTAKTGEKGCAECARKKRNRDTQNK